MEVQMGGLGVAGVQMSGNLVERQQAGRACCQFAPCSMDSVCLLSNLSHKAAAMRQVKGRASRVTVLRRVGNNNRLSLAVSVRSRAGVLEPPHGTLAENSLPKHENYTVGDFMTRAGDLFVANIDTTVDEGMYVKNLEAAGLMMMMPLFFPCFSAQIVQQGLNLIVTKSCWNDHP
jgi:hypothetical protein